MDLLLVYFFDYVGYCPVITEAYVIMLSVDYGYDYDNYYSLDSVVNDLIFLYVS